MNTPSSEMQTILSDKESKSNMLLFLEQQFDEQKSSNQKICEKSKSIIVLTNRKGSQETKLKEQLSTQPQMKESLRCKQHQQKHLKCTYDMSRVNQMERKKSLAQFHCSKSNNVAKQVQSLKLLGGGCGSSRGIDIKNVKQIKLKEKNLYKLDPEFINQYNIYTNKDQIQENILRGEIAAAQQFRLLNSCFSVDIQVILRNNAQQYKSRISELIEVYSMYTLSQYSREMLKKDELDQLGIKLSSIAKSFESESKLNPTLDLAYQFELLFKLNGCRVGFDKANETNWEDVATFLWNIVSLGVSVVKGDIGDVVKNAIDLGGKLFNAYEKNNNQKIFLMHLELYKKKIEEFKNEIWSPNKAKEIKFYIQQFCNLDQKHQEDIDYVLMILLKINYVLMAKQKDPEPPKKDTKNETEEAIKESTQKDTKEPIKEATKEPAKEAINEHTKEPTDQELIRQCLPLTSELSYQLLQNLLQQLNNKDDNVLLQFFKFTMKNPVFRFVSISILLRYSEIMSVTANSKHSKYLESITVYLIYKYLCEKEDSVKQVFETNEPFQNIYNERIKDDKFLVKIEEMSKKRRTDFQQDLASIEEIIDGRADIDRLIANNLIEKWEREVRMRQEQNIAKKDDILLEVKDFYIQQSVTYLNGNKIFSKNLPDDSSQTQLPDKDHVSQLQNAVQSIKDCFLSNNNEACKILGILAEGGTGKSMLLKKLETDLIEKQTQQNEEGITSTGNQLNYIPLLVKCNSLDPKTPSIEKYLETQGIPSAKIELLKKSARTKVILLDAYDEYQGEQFQVYSKLNLKDWKNIKVIVTSRKEKLSEKDACDQFCVQKENGIRDDQSYCLLQLEEFNSSDIHDYCERYFQKMRNQDQALVQSDLACIQDCLENQYLKQLLYLPINLYLFTRMIAETEDRELISEIKSQIQDQIGIQEIFFKQQFERETLDFLTSHPEVDKGMSSRITNCYFEYFQSIAMQMFLNKGKQGIANFLQLQKKDIQFQLNSNLNKLLNKQKQKDLLEKIKSYVNSKIITRAKEIDLISNKAEVLEFKHKSLFEYFAARAMKYDFDVHCNQIYNLSIGELSKFNINKRSIMNPGTNQSEQQILIKLYKLLQRDIDSDNFRQNYHDSKIDRNPSLIQYLKKSSISKEFEQSQIDIGASNLISALFLSGFAFPQLKLTLLSFSKAYLPYPKANSINLYKCNLEHAYLQGSCLNYDSCYVKSAFFSGFQKMFDSANISSFLKIQFLENNFFCSISESGFVSLFQIVQSQKIQHISSKQLSQTPLTQIKIAKDKNLLVSSQYSIMLIGSDQKFELKGCYKFMNSILNFEVTEDDKIVVTFNDGNAELGNIEKGFKPINIAGQGSVYNRKNQILLTYNEDEISLWKKLKENFQHVSSTKGHSKRITYIAISPNGTYLSTCSMDNTCKIWNIEKDSFELITTLEKMEDNQEIITSVAFSHDGKFLTTGYSNKGCKLWNAEEGSFQLLSTIEGQPSNINNGQIQVHIKYITSVIFSEDGKYLATGWNDNICKIWNTKQGNFKLISTIEKIKGHYNQITSVAFSPDGKYLITGSKDNTFKIWKAEKSSFELIRTVEGHYNDITSVAFSPDGKYLATGSKDKTLKIWYAERGSFELIKTSEIHQNNITSVAFSPNSKYIATGSEDEMIKIWDIEKDNLEQIKIIKSGQRKIISVAFSPDGKYLATGSKDRTYQIWDFEKGSFELIKSNNSHYGSITSVAFSPNGKYFATGSGDKTCQIWDIEKYSFDLIKTIDSHSNLITSIAFSSDSKYLATGSKDNTCKIWDAERGSFELISTIEDHYTNTTSVAFSPNCKYLATGFEDNTCKVWDIEKGSFELLSITKDHSKIIDKIYFSPNGKYLATKLQLYGFKIWKKEKNSFELINIIKEEKITSVEFSLDDKYLALTTVNLSCKIWDIEKGSFELIWEDEGYLLTHITSVRFSQDSKYFVAVYLQNFAIYKIDNGEVTYIYSANQNYENYRISSITFSYFDNYLAIGSEGQPYKIWKKEKDSFILFSTIEDKINSIAFSHDEKFLITCSKDQTCKIWVPEQDSFKFMRTIDEYCFSVVFSPDDKYLATNSWNKPLKIWNAEKGSFELIRTIKTPQNTSFKFSPDRKYLATSSYGKTFKIWKAEKGSFELIRTIEGHSDRITSVVFSLDSKYLATSSNDKTCKIWNVENADSFVLCEQIL